jgi:uncharacterized membrane protein
LVCREVWSASSSADPEVASVRRSTRSDRSWLGEELRTNLWVVPAILVGVAVLLFAVTYRIDQAAYHGDITLPSWVNNGSADAARQVLIALAAAVITVVGVVFSVTIVALTLASSQFGPRMLRNFIRDRGTQFTLGCFVGTFVYDILALGSIGQGEHGTFVPHLSVTVALVLVLVDLVVLIYFIHHVATSIQLPSVIAGIASDLRRAAVAQLPQGDDAVVPGRDAGVDAALAALAGETAVVTAADSGYLQFVSHRRLVEAAAAHDARVEMVVRAGDFVSTGTPVARVAPPSAVEPITQVLHRVHITGPQRTLTQDMAFAVDQLVEIAIRALSPAVNDTFTALTCIDWLGDGLALVTSRWESGWRVYRDGEGRPRVFDPEVGYANLVDRAFDKIRNAGRGMPAVLDRQLESLARVLAVADEPEQRAALVAQAQLVVAAAEAVPDPIDRAAVQARYTALCAAIS